MTSFGFQRLMPGQQSCLGDAKLPTLLAMFATSASEGKKPGLCHLIHAVRQKRNCADNINPRLA
jgi:hypothetical protein